MTRSSKRRHGFPQPVFQRLLPLLAGGSLLAVHIHVTRQGLEYTGALLLVDHLFDIAIVLLVLLICAAAGRLALIRLRTRFDQPIEELLFSTAVGAGLVSTLILALGLTVGLQPWVLWLFTMTLVLVLRNQIQDTVRSCINSVHRLLSADREYPVVWFLGLLVFVTVAGFLLVHAAAPPTDWDTLTYHISVPSDFITVGRLHVPEDNLHVSLTGLFHFLYLPLLAAYSPSAPALLSAATTLLLAVAVFAFCSRFLTAQTAAMSLAGLWGTTTILLVAITPRTDVTLAFFLFLAHYALLIALLDSSSRAHFLTAGALLGFAFGVKFPAGTYILGLLPLIVWTARSLDPAPARMAKNLLFFGLLAGLAGVPWLIKNWLLLGAPAYPFLSSRLLQPWLVPLLGSHHVPASSDPSIVGMEWALRNTFNLRDAFLSPDRLTIGAEGTLYFLNPLFIVLPLGLLFWRNRTMMWLLIPAVLSLAFLLVPFPYSNPRYLISSLIPLTIVALHSIFLIAQRFVGSRKSYLILTPTLLAALLPTALAVYVWTTQVNPVPHLIGAASKEQFLDGHPFVEEHKELVDYVNSELPKESRVLLLFEARGYYFSQDVLQDNSFTNWPWLLSSLDDDGCLGKTDITHVVVNRYGLFYYISGGLDPRLIRWERWEAFRARCLVLIHSIPVAALRVAAFPRAADAYSVYRVKADPSPNADRGTLRGQFEENDQKAPNDRAMLKKDDEISLACLDS